MSNDTKAPKEKAAKAAPQAKKLQSPRIFASPEAKKYIDSMIGKSLPFNTQEEAVDHIVGQSRLMASVDHNLMDRLTSVSEMINMTVDEIVLDAVRRRVEALENQYKKLQEISDSSNDQLAAIKGVRGVAFKRIELCVQEIMKENDQAKNWWDKTFITQGAILKRISARTSNIKTYLDGAKEMIEEHHLKHSEKDPEHALDEDFNRKKAIELQKQKAKG